MQFEEEEMHNKEEMNSCTEIANRHQSHTLKLGFSEFVKHSLDDLKSRNNSVISTQNS